MCSKPTVSIITACYNSANTLQKTIQSVLNQKFKDFEYIIIDGGSTDGTVEVIKRYKEHLAYWVSEPDDGIYAAWNKALTHASGKWIVFLGSDDCFVDNHVLSDLMGLADTNIDFVFGKHALIAITGVVVNVCGRPWNFAQMKQWMSVSHPGALHNRKLFEVFGKFDESFKIAGDYEFLLRVAMHKRINSRFLDRVIVHMNLGCSHNNAKLAFKENYRIHRVIANLSCFKAAKLYYMAILKKVIKKIYRKLT